MKAPTEKQYRALRILGPGRILLSPGKGEHGPLLRRGWLEPAWPDREFPGKYPPPLRITSAGLRALADGIDLYGQETAEITAEVVAMRLCSCARGERPRAGCSVHGAAESERARDERTMRVEYSRLTSRLGRIAELAKEQGA